MNKEEQIKFIEDNYPATTHHTSNRRIRHNFFQNIETELQAYLLGFYAADGSIDEKRKTFRVELQNKDSELVYLYKDIISTDARLYSNPAKDFMGPKGKMIHTEGSIGVDITSIKLCEDLVNLGIGYRKSYADLHIPNIAPNLIPHFIRGYFDGDGSFSMYIVSPANRPRTYLKCHFSIDAKKISLLEEIQKELSKFEINTKINYLRRDDMYRVGSASKETVKKFFHYLYDDANFMLKRKFDKFNHYVNTEESQLIAELRNALEMNVKESNNSPTSAEHPTTEDENIC